MKAAIVKGNKYELCWVKNPVMPSMKVLKSLMLENIFLSAPKHFAAAFCVTIFVI